MMPRPVARISRRDARRRPSLHSTLNPRDLPVISVMT